MTSIQDFAVRKVLALAPLLIVAILVHALMFRFEIVGGGSGMSHRFNRLTGSVLFCAAASCEWAEMPGSKVKKVAGFVDDAGILDDLKRLEDEDRMK